MLPEGSQIADRAKTWESREVSYTWKSHVDVQRLRTTQGTYEITNKANRATDLVASQTRLELATYRLEPAAIRCGAWSTLLQADSDESIESGQANQLLVTGQGSDNNYERPSRKKYVREEVRINDDADLSIV